MIPDTTARIIVSLSAADMALAFILADRLSPTRKAQAVFLAFVGVSSAADALWVLPMRRAEGVVPWGSWRAMPQVLAITFAYERVLRVRQTIPLRDLNTRGPLAACCLLRAACCPGAGGVVGSDRCGISRIKSGAFRKHGTLNWSAAASLLLVVLDSAGTFTYVGYGGNIVDAEPPPRPGRRKAPDRVCHQCPDSGGGGHIARTYHPNMWCGGPAGTVGGLGPMPRDAGASLQSGKLSTGLALQLKRFALPVQSYRLQAA